MAFTGRLGSLNSKLGSIVLGFVDDFGAAAAGFTVHQLTSKKIRVNFGIKVLGGALDPSHYVLSTTAPPTVTKVPSVVSVSFYDENDRSVVVEYDLSLTYLSTYTMEVSNIIASTGDEIVRFSRNFVVNVQDPPLPIGAWQSKRGFVDLLFDRDVGPTSGASFFSIQDAAGGIPVPMIQVPWATTGAPATTLRLELPGGTPTANSFVVNYLGVKDASFNTDASAVPVPLTLAPQRDVSPPYSLASLLQLKVTSAVVLSANPKQFFATIRVFFNGPVGDAGNPLLWTVVLPGLHRTSIADPNVITAPVAIDLPSVILLANDGKAQFNAHIVYPNFHVTDDPSDAVTSPDATDLPTVITLLTELMAKFIAHQNKGIPVHTFRTNNGFTGAPTDLPSSISWANTFKADYADHQFIQRQAPFDLSLPSAIAGIEDHSKYGNPDTVFDVSSPFTYYVDLRVSADAENFVLPFAILCGVTSEDGLSTVVGVGSELFISSAVGDVSESFPMDFSPLLGDDSLFPRIIPFFGNVSPERSVEVFMHGANFTLPETLNFSLAGPDGPVDLENVEVSASLPAILWALNEAIFSYSVHIAAPGLGGATHLALDTVNTITDPTDYARLPLPTFFSAANSLKAKMNAHMASPVFHFQPDFAQVRSADADDVPSLIALVDEIRRVLASHNLLIGPHSDPGQRNLTAPLYDVLRFFPSEMVAGDRYSVSGPVLTSLYLPGSFYEGTVIPQGSSGGTLVRNVSILGAFLGLATRPSLASAVPRTGLVINEEGAFYVPDAIEVYFSKPMRQVPLDPSNLSVTGGTILQKETGWVSEVLASVKVARMASIPYSVVAAGITDSSGNAVY